MLMAVYLLLVDKMVVEKSKLFSVFFFQLWICSHSSVTRYKKWSFPLRISSVNVTKSAGNCILATFTEEILNGKLCIVIYKNMKLIITLIIFMATRTTRLLGPAFTFVCKLLTRFLRMSSLVFSDICMKSRLWKCNNLILLIFPKGTQNYWKIFFFKIFSLFLLEMI